MHKKLSKLICTTIAMASLVLASAGVAFADNGEGSIEIPQGMKLKIGGRLFVDTATPFAQSSNSNMGSGADIGAARMRVEGKYGNWSFQLQYDLTESGAKGIKFAYLRYSGFKLGDMSTALTLGNQFEQFGLENRTSSKYVTFLAQSVPFAAVGVGPRHLGLAWSGLRGPVHWGLGVYGQVPGYETNSAHGATSGLDFATRLAYDPIATRNELVHIEGSARYHKYEGETDIGTHNDSVLGAHAAFPTNGLYPVLIAARAPGSHPNHMTNYDVAFSGVYHAFNVQAEYYLTQIYGLRGVGTSNVTYRGYYAQAGWYLTGESRRFVRTPAYDIFIGTHPNHPVNKGGWGAWEIAARYSEADLNDGHLGPAGKERDITLGLNWTPVYHVRFLLDFDRVLPIQGGANDGKSFDVIGFRSIVFW